MAQGCRLSPTLNFQPIRSENYYKFSEFVFDHVFFLWNFFELFCRLSENAAKMRENSDRILEEIQRPFSAREVIDNLTYIPP